ncbi:hypothetical protein Hanom_Chr05g00425121 [Helianthus anomalus]
MPIESITCKSYTPHNVHTLGEFSAHTCNAYVKHSKAKAMNHAMPYACHRIKSPPLIINKNINH